MGDVRREEQLRIQAVGAAISRRDWHAVEQAYNAIRDEFDRRPTSPSPASRGLTVRLNEKGLEAACEAVLAVPDHPGDKQKIRDAIATYIKVDLKDRAR